MHDIVEAILCLHIYPLIFQKLLIVDVDIGSKTPKKFRHDDMGKMFLHLIV